MYYLNLNIDNFFQVRISFSTLNFFFSTQLDSISMNFYKNNQSTSSSSISEAPRASTDSAVVELKMIHVHSDNKRRFDLKVIIENGIMKVGFETWK